MRRFAACFRFVWLAAGLALLLVPAAQAKRSTAGDIVGSWTNLGGGITVKVSASGSGYVGDLTRVVGSTPGTTCSSFTTEGDAHAWTITLPNPAGGTYTGQSMQGIGGMGSTNSVCWPEGSQQTTWSVDVAGTSLVMTFVDSNTRSTWTKSGSTTGTGTDTATTTAAQDNAVRTGVNKAFNAIYKANKALSKCTWGHCRKAAIGLQRVAQSWRGCFRRTFQACTSLGASAAVKAGRRDAIKALNYWTQTAIAAIKTDNAFKAGDVARTKYWYRVYLTKFKQAVKYKNRAVKLLWPS
jgi:hypothetical protein